MPRTRLQKSFASALATPSKEEVFLDLQHKFILLQNENFELKARLHALENKVDYIEKAGKMEVIKTIIEDPPQQLVSKVEEMVNGTIELKVENKVGNQVQLELKEQKWRSDNSLKLRVGGLPEDWSNVFDAFPEIDWEACPKTVREFKDHAVLTFADREDRLKILKQTKNLKGTRKWISEELTIAQLRQRPAELEKVKAARKIGKWAVYREGIAIIRDFKTYDSGSQP